MFIWYVSHSPWVAATQMNLEPWTSNTIHILERKHWTMQSLEVELWCGICLDGIYLIWLNILDAIVVSTQLMSFREIVNDYYHLHDQWQWPTTIQAFQWFNFYLTYVHCHIATILTSDENQYEIFRIFFFVLKSKWVTYFYE